MARIFKGSRSLPTTHAFIHNWYESYLPLSSQLMLVLGQLETQQAISVELTTSWPESRDADH